MKKEEPGEKKDEKKNTVIPPGFVEGTPENWKKFREKLEEIGRPNLAKKLKRVIDYTSGIKMILRRYDIFIHQEGQAKFSEEQKIEVVLSDKEDANKIYVFDLREFPKDPTLELKLVKIKEKRPKPKTTPRTYVEPL